LIVAGRQEAPRQFRGPECTAERAERSR
jgi:hypothetical protein